MKKENEKLYTLNNAIECKEPYRLKIDDEFPFLPTGSEIWIAPMDEQSRNFAKFWLFRAKNMSQALIRRAVIDGDQHALVPVNAAPNTRYDSVVYTPEQDGEVLGVVQDTVLDIENSSAAFWFSSH